MIVRKMTANFGVLSHAELELEPGLNVIQLPNESGKSTWCAFLRLMLYGPEQGRRGKAGERSERSFAPWDGTPASGELELSAGGRDITLRRWDLPSGGFMRGFSAVYTGTNQTVSSLGSSDAGELLTGMTLPVFTRTAFIGPSGLAVDQSPELEKKIGSLMSSGEEGISFTEAAERLRAEQHRIRYRGKGLLPNLEAERDQLNRSLDEISETTDRLQLLETGAESAAERIEVLRRTAPRELDRTQELLAAQRKLLDMERELRERESGAEQAARDLRSGVLKGKAPTKETERTMRADRRRAGELRKSRGGLTADMLWTVFLGLAIVFAIAGIFFRGALAPAAGCLLVSLGLRLSRSKTNRRSGKKDRELAALLKKYGAAFPEEIPERYAEYVRDWEKVRALRTEAEQLRARVKKASEQSDKLRAAEKTIPDMPQLAQLEEELSQMDRDAARLRGRLDTMGDPVRLREWLESIDAERARLETRYDALEMALNELKNADEELHARFAPALSRETEAVFRSLTGERYDQLTLDRDLTAAVREAGETVPRSAELLSRGTRDQLYLSVRLALCDLIPADEPCPIILDDAMLSFDDERMARALDHLKEISTHRQIILFTCQSREKQYLTQ